MKLLWTEEGWQDYLFWQGQAPKTVEKINALIAHAQRNPFKRIGKPEPLKGELSGWWSRRITGEHRLVYRMAGTGSAQHLEIAACRYHY